MELPSSSAKTCLETLRESFFAENAGSDNIVTFHVEAQKLYFDKNMCSAQSLQLIKFCLKHLHQIAAHHPPSALAARLKI